MKHKPTKKKKIESPSVLVTAALIALLALVLIIVFIKPPTLTQPSDTDFRSWSLHNAETLSPFMSQINSVITNYSYQELKTLSISYQSTIASLLNNITKYNLSAHHEPTRTEYTAFLQDLDLCCKYLELFTTDYDQTELKIAISYFDSATEHIDHYYRYIETY